VAAELDVSVSSQQAVTGVNDLLKVFQQLIDSVKKVDSTLATGQQQIDKLGNAFTSESGEIKNAVGEISASLKKAQSDLEAQGKAQEASISRASRYISKLQDLIKIEQYALEVNKKNGLTAEEAAKRKAVFAAQVQKNISAMAAEGKEVESLVRKLMGLEQANKNLAAGATLADKRKAFNTTLAQEADILSRVNARATELGVKVTELAAYKQFLAQATKLNIDLNSQEFASLQKLYIAKEEQIRLGRTITTPPAAPNSKARDKSTSQVDRYISKLKDLVRVEQYTVDINKKMGIAAEETAKRKAVYTAQTLRHIAATTDEGKAVDSLIRRLHLLQGIKDRQEKAQASVEKRQAFNNALVQEADILARVNARATELGVKVTELAAYKQFLAQATKLNIDLNSQEFASLQKLYIAKEEQIRLGRTIATPPAAPNIPSRTAGVSIATTPAALELEIEKTRQLLALHLKHSGNTAELAIQKEILNRKIAAGNSLSDIEISRIEKRIRALYQNKDALTQLALVEERRQRVSGVVGGLSSEGAQLDKTIAIYQQHGKNVQEVAIQKEILNRVTAAGGTVTAQEYKNIEAGVRSTAKKRVELEKLEKQYGNTTAATSRFSGGLTRMQLILSGIVYMGLSRAVSSVADFYTNLSIANAVTEASVSEMGQLEAAARKLGETTVFTAGEAATGIQFLGQAGMGVENILKTLPDTLNLASAGSIDLGRAADIATNMMASFGLQAGQMGQAADIIAYTAAKSNTNVEQLAEGMKYAGPAARAAGLDLGETAAIIGTLSNAGLQASTAGTSLRQALIQLSKEPTKNATKALKELGLTFDDVSLKNNTFEQAITKLASRGMNLGQAAAIFDTRAATAMLALSELMPVWDRLNEGVEKSAGTAERMARIRLDNLTGDFRLLASAVEELILTLGDAGFLTLLRSITNNSKDVVLAAQDLIGEWNALWEVSEKSVDSLTQFSQKATDLGMAFGLSSSGLGKFRVGLGDVKTQGEKAEEPIIKLTDLALNLGKAMVTITGIRLGYWALDSATGVGLLAKSFYELAKAYGVAAAAGVALKGAVAWLSGPTGVVLVAAATGTVLKEWYDINSETEKANSQIATMNRQLEDMAMYSKRAATELIKTTAEQYNELFKGLRASGVKLEQTAHITVGNPKPKQLLDDWRNINEELAKYEGRLLWPADAIKVSKLTEIREAMGPMVQSLTMAWARLNSNLETTEVKLSGIQTAVQMVSAISSGMPAAIFQIGKPQMPNDDSSAGGEDRGKSYENFVKNLERANKEQKKLNELRKEYGDNEDLINLKLKIYNTLLEAKDIKGGISSAETKRIENLITETAKQEDLNNSLKAFIDLQKETRNTAAMAQYASTYGTDSMQYVVAKKMKDFLKENQNLPQEQIMATKEMFIKQFFDERTIRDTKKGEKKDQSDADKANEAYKKYLANIERDIEVTSTKMKLAEQYGLNQDLLNVKMKDYEQRLRIEAELKERNISLDSDRGKEIEYQLKLRDEIKEKYDAELDRVKKIIDVNKELANTFVGAIKEAKNFRDAFIRLGDAAEEMILKMVANKASESLFGLLLSGVGKAAGFSTTIGPNDVAVNGTGGFFSNGNKVQAFGSGGVFTSTTAFPMPNGQIGIAGERGNEVFMPAKRMSNGDVGVRVQVPPTSKSTGGVAISNQFNIKVDGGSKTENDDAANKVSKSVELAVRNVVYDVIMREKNLGGTLRR